MGNLPKQLVVVGIVLLAWAGAGQAQSAGAAPGAVRLWDTGAPLTAQGGLARRAQWRPIAATSAPGVVRGDLVVETGALAMAFASRLGRVLVYSQGQPVQSKAALLPSECVAKRPLSR